MSCIDRSTESRPESFPSTAALSGIAAGVGSEIAARWARASGKIHWKELGEHVLPLCGAWPVLATTHSEELLTCWECAAKLAIRQLLHREGLE